MAHLDITKDNFQSLVLNSSQTVLLDFWAPWCGPCRMIAPVLEEIQLERKDLIIGKINVDEEAALAAQFGIVSIPTLIVMKNGRKVSQGIGYMPKSSIIKLLEAE